MGFITESGYSLPGGDLPLTHARVLHAGNRFRPALVTPSDEQSGSPASAAQNGLTFEKWRPFTNAISQSTDFSGSAWTKRNLNVGADGQTLTETSDSGFHDVQLSLSVTAEEWVFGAIFKSPFGSNRGAEVVFIDSTASAFLIKMRSDGSITSSVGDVAVTNLGNNFFMARIAASTAAGAGTFAVRMNTASGSGNYTGDGQSQLQLVEVFAHPSIASYRMDLLRGKECDVFCIAGHNFGPSAGKISFEHDSNEDDTFAEIDNLTDISDNSPIMFLFAPVTSARWRVTVSRTILPEIAVVQVGKALQMQRPIHQGVRPFETNRSVQMRGNLSEGGEWLGRSTIRGYLEGSLSFSRLTPAWVRSNLDGVNGFIQAAEREPFFVAWRPDTYAEAHYVWTSGRIAGPTFSQSPNLMSWAIPTQGLLYE